MVSGEQQIQKQNALAKNDEEITDLLKSLGGGEEAVKKVYPVVYKELHAMAHRQLRSERADHTLNTTALVHEAYIKLSDFPPMSDLDGRHHFFGIAARAMRQVLVNYARKRNTQKRSGSKKIEPFEDEFYLSEEKTEELIELDEALNQLEKYNKRHARVVECRYFAGYDIDETADILGVSSATVKRDWTSARAWLHAQVNSNNDP